MTIRMGISRFRGVILYSVVGTRSQYFFKSNQNHLFEIGFIFSIIINICAEIYELHVRCIYQTRNFCVTSVTIFIIIIQNENASRKLFTK